MQGCQIVLPSYVPKIPIWIYIFWRSLHRVENAGIFYDQFCNSLGPCLVYIYIFYGIWYSSMSYVGIYIIWHLV
jgi:hypothetical protein